MRIAVVQPWLGHYRTPLYDLLGRQPGVEITVFGADARPPTCAPGPDASYRFIAQPFQGRRLGLINLRFQQAQLDVMDRARFDLVILTWDVSIYSVWPALRRARRIGMPVILWGHGYSLRAGGWRGKLRDAARNALGRRAAALMVYTRSGKERIVREFGFDPARVFVAQNALDQRPIAAARAAWLADPDRLAAFQREHDIDPASAILHVSRLIPEKDPSSLLRAMALLKQENPRARLILIGDGPTRPALEALARDLALGDSIRFVGAIYDETQLAPWMLSAACMCYPFSAGLSILHAFGYGLPVVAGDRPDRHNPEVEALEHERSALLFPVAPTPLAENDPASLRAMVEAWRRLMHDPALRRSLATRAGQLAREVYTIPNMAQGFLDAFAVVDGRRRSLVIPPGSGWEAPVERSPPLPPERPAPR